MLRNEWMIQWGDCCWVWNRLWSHPWPRRPSWSSWEVLHQMVASWVLSGPEALEMEELETRSHKSIFLLTRGRSQAHLGGRFSPLWKKRRSVAVSRESSSCFERSSWPAGSWPAPSSCSLCSGKKGEQAEDCSDPAGPLSILRSGPFGCWAVGQSGTEATFAGHVDTSVEIRMDWKNVPYCSCKQNAVSIHHRR